MLQSSGAGSERPRLSRPMPGRRSPCHGAKLDRRRLQSPRWSSLRSEPLVGLDCHGALERRASRPAPKAADMAAAVERVEMEPAISDKLPHAFVLAKYFVHRGLRRLDRSAGAQTPKVPFPQDLANIAVAAPRPWQRHSQRLRKFTRGRRGAACLHCRGRRHGHVEIDRARGGSVLFSCRRSSL